MSSPVLNRRRFIRQTASATLAASLLPGALRGAADSASRGDKIRLGMIGTGNYGTQVLQGFLHESDARVVAVCDVHRDRVERARTIVNRHYEDEGCAAYHDFRDVIARSDIDAVGIATPDHWHAIIAVAAARAGKDIYLEKPLSLTIGEGQVIRDVVRQNKRVFQFGTFQRASANFRRACEMVRSGLIGRLDRINVWCIGSVPGGPTEPLPVPPALDFDFWLGPAPERPYTENLCGGGKGWSKWFFNSDFCIGFIAGWGIHPMDIASWACPEMFAGPIEVAGTGVIPTEGICNTATEWDVNFKFAGGPTLNFRGLPVASDRQEDIKKAVLWRDRYGRTRDHGTAFEGTDGWILVDRDHLDAHPKSLLRENPDKYPVKVNRIGYPAQNFLECVRSRGTTIADIDDAFRSDTLCNLANLAIRTQRKLTWDPATGRFTGDEAANRLLAVREMRQPWRLL